jgi:hypothetical protein
MMQQANWNDAAAPAGGQTQSPASSSVSASTDSAAAQPGDRPAAAQQGVKVAVQEVKVLKEFIKTHGGLTTIPFKVSILQTGCPQGVCCDLAVVLQQQFGST